MNIELVKALLGKWVSFHPIFAEVGGSVTAGVMLSQAYHWSSRTSDPNGWFYKTQKEWNEETALTRYEQESARKQLREKGILEEKLEGVPAKLYYRLHFGELLSKLTVAAKLKSLSMRENHILGCGETADKIAGLPQPPISNKDTTYLPELKNSGSEGELLTLSSEPVEKPKRGRPPKPADPRHQEAIAMFFEMYQERFNARYGVTAADGKNLKTFLQTFPEVTVTEMRETLSAIWSYEVNERKTGKYVGRGSCVYTLKDLVTRWNEITGTLKAV